MDDTAVGAAHRHLTHRDFPAAARADHRLGRSGEGPYSRNLFRREVHGPLIGEAGVVSATLDLDRIAAGRRAFDPTGHYARPDILHLTINPSGTSHD